MRTKKKVLVAWLDNCSLPRAWARGPADKLEEVRAAAKEYLEQYKRGKPDPSCILELEPFSEQVQYYEEDESNQRSDDAPLQKLEFTCPSCGSDPDVDCICKGHNR